MLSEVDGAQLSSLARIALAIGLGLLVGLERYRAGKDTGLRTFALTCLAGAIGGMVSPSVELAVLGMVAIVVILSNAQELLQAQPVHVTTTVALFVTAILGMLVGRGYVLVPVASAILMTVLLAWREELVGFATLLTDQELRSALTLGILTFIVYPALPDGYIDPWNIVQPRQIWITVILIAAIGFANYVLLRRFGAQGLSLTGLLGGVVNSTATVTELAQRARLAPDKLERATYRGVVFANVAMLLRNGLILVILAPQIAIAAAFAPATAVVVSLVFALTWREAESRSSERIELASPFSVAQVLRFGLIFLAITVAGDIGQRQLGSFGLYAVSFLGGLVSSASSTATIATLASQGKIGVNDAVVGALLASMASLIGHPILVSRLGPSRALARRVWAATAGAVAAGLVGVGIWLVVR